MIRTATAAKARRLPRVHVLATWSGRIGIGLCGLVLLVAAIGPAVAPHSPSEIIAAPFSPPGADALLGTDFLGRDLLSRVLWGGWTIIGLGVLSTGLAYLVGATIGLVAGLSRSWFDSVLMRVMDVLLVFPPLLFLLVLAAGAGRNAVTVVVGVAIVQVPGIARVIRAATLDVSVRGYLEAAVGRGESKTFILTKEVLPNIASTVAADGGPRLTVSILLIAALNFLGLGLQPPTADWALMITENRPGLTFQPWGVIVPAALIALLTIGVNILADSIARGLGIRADPLKR